MENNQQKKGVNIPPIARDVPAEPRGTSEMTSVHCTWSTEGIYMRKQETRMRAGVATMGKRPLVIITGRAVRHVSGRRCWFSAQ